VRSIRVRKVAILVALVLVFASKRADACRGGPCPPWISAMGYTLGAGLAGGYAYGTGYMIYRDITDVDQSMAYGGSELIINGAGTFLFGGAVVDAIAHEHYGAATALAPFALVHTSLMVHGGWRAYHERDEFRLAPDSKEALLWTGGFAWIANTLIWSGQLGSDHGRAYGIGEAAVNAPLAIGLGYLAYDRFSSWHPANGFAYGSMAAISGALTIHGIHTALRERQPDLDLLGDIAPMMVTDGIEMAPGLGAGGTW
jgi:hypothetical protein